MLGIKKPVKADRPNEIRKREIRRKDKELSKETRKKPCVICGQPSEPAHIVPRRFMKLRHSPLNVLPKCRKHHLEERYNKVEQRIRLLHNDPTL